MADSDHGARAEEILAHIALADPASLLPEGDDVEAHLAITIDGVPWTDLSAPPAALPGAPSAALPDAPRQARGPKPGAGQKFKLTTAQRIAARDRAVLAAALALKNSVNVHYTQGPKRWEGIEKKLRATKGQYPKNADCSALATWCLWNALNMYNAPDVVNNAGWKAGYTGTQLSCGTRVTGDVMRGDLAIYGTGPPGKHVAICIGDGMVISHGSEKGPYKVKLDYRRDLMEIRRYF